MILIILTIILIAVSTYGIYNDWDDVAVSVSFIIGMIMFSFILTALLSRSIENKDYPIEYSELIDRIEKCEYSESMKQEIYRHNLRVKKNRAWKDNAFIGVFYAPKIGELPLIEYKEISQENKITLIKGE
jgi:hypothetical protein